MITRRLAISLAAAALLVTAAQADPPDELQVLGTFPTGGPCRSVTGTETTLHFGTGGYLASADITDPTSPELLALTGFATQVQDVELASADGTILACVCLGTSGLRLVDVTDPTGPQLLGSLSDIEASRAVWVAPRLYLISEWQGGLVVNIADPTAPVVTGQFLDQPDQRPRAIAFGQSFLFVACFDQTLYGFSLVQPDVPLELWTRPGSYQALACAEPGLVLGLGGTGMDVIDASDFSHIEPIGAWAPVDPAGRPTDLAVNGDRVWIADRVLGLHLVDIADPVAPTSLDLLPEREGQAWAIGQAGGLMALGKTSEGVRLCQAAGPDNDEITVLATCTEPYPAPIKYLGVSNDHIVGASENRELSVFSPLVIGERLGQVAFDHPHFAEIRGFDADDGLAFLAARLNQYSYVRMYVFDVLNPSIPFIVYEGHGLPVDGVGEVAMDGHLAFVDCSGIYAYDLSNPYHPDNAGLYGFSHGVTGVELLEQMALVTWDPQEPGLVVVDRTNTWDMELLEVLPVPTSPSAMAALGDRFYATTANAVWIFDVSTPGESQHLGTIEVGGYVREMAASSAGVWVALGFNGLELWDLSDPLSPVLQAVLTGQGRIETVAPVGDLALVNAPHAGVLWVSPDAVSAAAEPRTPSPPLLQNTPNPFNPRTTIRYKLANPGPVSLQVFDVGGRLVRVLTTGWVETADARKIIWDGYDSWGRAMPSGTYILRLETEAGVEARKMALVR